jgi:hypothetical protein
MFQMQTHELIPVYFFFIYNDKIPQLLLYTVTQDEYILLVKRHGALVAMIVW